MEPRTEQSLPRVLTASALCVCLGLFSVVACTHTTDRVLEPVGGGDASTTVPEATDASVTPIGPVAPAEPKEEPPSEDFRLARSPELGQGIHERAQLLDTFADTLPGQGGGGGTSGGVGVAGAGGRGRPVTGASLATGGTSYY